MKISSVILKLLMKNAVAVIEICIYLAGFDEMSMHISNTLTPCSNPP